MIRLLEGLITRKLHTHARPGHFDRIRGVHNQLKQSTGLGAEGHDDLEPGDPRKGVAHISNIVEEGVIIGEKSFATLVKTAAKVAVALLAPTAAEFGLVVAEITRATNGNNQFPNPILEKGLTGGTALIVDLAVGLLGYGLAIRSAVKSIGNGLREMKQNAIKIGEEKDAFLESAKATPDWFGGQVEDTRGKLGQVKGQVTDTGRRLLGR